MLNLQTPTDKRFKVVLSFILLGALCRLLPHPLNFSPIGAIALFGGTYIQNKRLALLLPLTAMLFSDILLQLFYGTGFHDQMIWVYASFALITGIGFLLRGREQRQTIMVASLVSSILFFTITNFGCWTVGLYGYTANGLADCYIAAIPFFRGTLMGDLFYNLVLFGGFALVRWAVPAIAGKKN